MFLSISTCPTETHGTYGPAEQHREYVRKQLRTILASGYSPMSFFMKDYKKYFYMAELLALVDLSLVRLWCSSRYSSLDTASEAAADPVSVSTAQTVKMGVQYSLWGGSVMNLGTERHKKQYFDAIDKFQIPGQLHTADWVCHL